MTSPAAHNYAKALVELMKERNQLDIARETAEKLIQDFNYPEIELTLRHPKVPAGQKKALLQKLLLPDTPREFQSCLDLVIDRGRQTLLLSILQTIVELSIIEQGFEIVTLVAAQSMADDERSAILTKLETLWQVKIFLKYRVNPGLLGGIIIQRGDKLYDGSLNGQLTKIKNTLIGQELKVPSII